MEEYKKMASELLIPTEEYLKYGVHIGTKFKTGAMEPFIYKKRPDGLSVLNLEKINERTMIAAKFLANYEPEDILVCGRRESAWKPIAMFRKATGARAMIGRYLPGILTNTNLKEFIEAKVVVVSDPWTDRNVVEDSIKVGIPVVALCDTNNVINKIDLVLPCNNKGKKSLAIIFWLLAREYLKLRGKITKDEEFEYKPEEFISD